jgi:hypothetical protein
VRTELGPALSVHSIWYAVRTGTIDLATAAPVGRGVPIRLDIRAGIDRDPISVVKVLVDGVVAGLQTHGDAGSMAWGADILSGRLSAPRDNVQAALSSGPVAIRGDARLVWARGSGLQWNPADDGIVQLDVQTRTGPPGTLEADVALVRVS